MQPTSVENASPITYVRSSYQVDNNHPGDLAETLSLKSRVMTATGSNASLATSICISEPENPVPGKPRQTACCRGAFQRFLLGVTALVSMGILATTGMHYIRRGGHEPQADGVLLAEFLPEMEPPFFATRITPSTPASYQPMHPTTALPFSNRASENDSAEPYSYYKDLYAPQTAANRMTALSAASSNLDLDKNSLTSVTSELITDDAALSPESINARNRFYTSLPNNMTDEWKSRIYFAMQEFYKIEIHNIMVMANNHKWEDKCGFLVDIIKKISTYKTEESILNKDVLHKLSVSACDQARIALANRKIEALISSAEVIIARQATTEYQEDILNNDIHYYNNDTHQRIVAIKKVIRNMFKHHVCTTVPAKIEPLKNYDTDKISCYF